MQGFPFQKRIIGRGKRKVAFQVDLFQQSGASTRQEAEIQEALQRHGDSVWRLCCTFFLGTPDAEDAYQETFLRFAQADETCFASDEHRKAWLLKVATNICRDMLRSAARKNTELDDRFADQQASASPYDTPDSRLAEVLDAMARLDDPPKTPLYLALYEGYRARDIAQMLDAPENTVYSWISRGKKMLREALI